MQHILHTLKAVKKKHFPSSADKKEREEEFNRRLSFYKGLISAGDLCFDVGANVGNRVAPLLKAGGKVVAIEPQKKCYELLKKKFGDQIELVTEGLGEKEGEEIFYISPSSTISSFSKEWIDAVKDDRFKNQKWNKTQSVKMTTLDALVSKFGVPAFIKIDVEGYELSVLKGLHHPVKIISIEYTVPEQTDRALDCIRQIEEINGKTAFNYSIGESMEFALTEWLDLDQMCDHVQSKDFTDTNFGDIYARKTD